MIDRTMASSMMLNPALRFIISTTWAPMEPIDASKLDTHNPTIAWVSKLH